MSVNKQWIAGICRTSYFLATLLLPVALCGLIAAQSLPEYLRQPETFGAQRVYATKEVASLLGEFRGSLAGFLYARAHEYLHQGILLRAATSSDRLQGVPITESGEVGLIPDKAHDPRSVWGAIERATQPCQDGEEHLERSSKEILPLIRLMTWSDPHFIEGYNLGSYTLFCFAEDHRLERTLTFLKEGVENNPDSYTLHMEYGQYQLDLMKNVSLAQQHFLAAAQSVEKMDAQQLKQLDEIDYEEARRAWEYLVICYRRTGDRQREVQWAAKGLKKFPDSMTCRRSLKKPQP